MWIFLLETWRGSWTKLHDGDQDPELPECASDSMTRKTGEEREGILATRNGGHTIGKHKEATRPNLDKVVLFENYQSFVESFGATPDPSDWNVTHLFS